MVTPTEPQQQSAQGLTLITDEQAINSIALLVVALCVAIGTAASLSKRLGSAVRSLSSRPSTTSRPSSASIDGAGSNWSVQAGHRRVLALFVSAWMHAGGCINSAVYYGYLWKGPDRTDAPISYAVDLLTIVPAGPLAGLAMAYRIAIVLVTHPRTRRRFLVATAMLTMLTPVAFASRVADGIVRNRHASIVSWQTIIVYGIETGPIIALFPTLCVGASLWLVKIVLTQTTPVPSTATTWEPDFPQLGESNARSKLTTGSSASSSSPNANDTQIASTATGQSVASSTFVLAQSLKSTFIMLSLIQALYWTLFLYILIMQPPMPFRASSMCVCLSTVACATEVGFEAILRKNRSLTTAVNQVRPLNGTSSLTNKAGKRVSSFTAKRVLESTSCGEAQDG